MDKPTPIAPASVAVELRDVSFSWSGKPALDHMDLVIAPGMVTAILGPNGCGKSTSVALMGRAQRPSSGSVHLLGEDIASHSRRQIAQWLAVLWQGARIPHMEVGQLVMSGRYPHAGFMHSPSKADVLVVTEAMERAGCAEFEHCYMDRLSGGQRQRAWLAMVLAQQTPIVIMDEPTAYLDARACFDLMDTAHDLAREGKAVVMVLHDLTLALAEADSIVVMDQGRVQAHAAPGSAEVTDAVERAFQVKLHRWREGDSGAQWGISRR